MEDRAEILAVAAAARDFLREATDFPRVRSVIESDRGWDAALWHGFAGELGFAGLAVAEEFGGAGLGPRALTAVAEVLGATLAPIPWFETSVLAAGTISATGASTALADAAAGRLAATLVTRGAHGNAGAIGPAISAGRLQGEAHFVPFAIAADMFVVAAAEGNGTSLFAVAADTPGVMVTPHVSLDLTRPLATITFDKVDVTAGRLGAPGAGDVALHAALRVARVVLAAEALGGMQRTLDETVAYAKQRVQFGRVIGSFQAIKHRLADMQLQVEAARSAVDWAVSALEAGGGDVESAGALAFCADAYHRLTADGIQLHGGIGFTWEHHAHLFFKRARGTLNLLDTPMVHRDFIAGILLDSPQEAA